MFRCTAVALITAFSFSTSFAFEADKEVEKLLASMRTAYSSVGSASLQATTKVEIEGKIESQSVAMDYQKPNLLRLVFSFRGQKITRISDGKKIYTMAEKGDPFEMRYSVEGLGNDSPINLESMSFFDWKRQLSTSPGANMEKSKFKLIESESWNGRSWIVLEETAHGQNVFVRYFVDPKTFYIWKCEVKTLDKKAFIMETEIESLELNVKHDPKLFAAPKKG